MIRQENPYFSAFTRHVAHVAQLNKPTGGIQTREAHPYNLIVLQQNFLTSAPLVKSFILSKPRYVDGKAPRGKQVMSMIDFMCLE